MPECKAESSVELIARCEELSIYFEGLNLPKFQTVAEDIEIDHLAAKCAFNRD